MDEYHKMRLDRIAEDVAVTRNKVESMERVLALGQSHLDGMDKRVQGLERKMFSLWLVGPLLLGAAALYQNLKNLMGSE
ncbi:MAG: hypothetical protein OEW12_06735 [Deltaproteobacteria bacterium]|nr:hypothetical protein [Deltaproteobacteria bacterium]